MKQKLFFITIAFFFFVSYAFAQNCIDCHKKVTPQIVKDWQLSKHSQNDVSCSTCHGEEHKTAADYAKAELPTINTCNNCHEKQVAQFKKGKHALAWAAMKAMPTFHMQPMALTEGKKGCGSCHKLGIKSEKEIKKLKSEGFKFGNASCDACHTRHLFSVKEARQPQACETCHMGFDHPQWEMYSSSKHGVRNSLKQLGIINKEAAAPTCQTCHMPNGNHEVRTAWGFLAVRLPMPKNKQWMQDRITILKALGALDMNGKPTALVKTLKAADVIRFTQADWQKERNKMINICTKCHSADYAKGELAKGDDMIRNADHLMAKAINVVAGLYKDGIIKKPKNYPSAYPFVLTFYNAPTEIEQKLYVMFSEHRMRTFQGTFHASPDYALWYGWGEMEKDLVEIKGLAAQMRLNHKLEK